MKYILFTLCLFSFFALRSQEILDNDAKENLIEEIQSEKGPVLVLDTSVVDYGTIEQHADPLRKLKFTNTGDAPLVISNAKGSCGCTVPNWPKKPIMPGESAELEIRYATNRLGKFTKTVTLTTNETNNQNKHVITVKGTVNQKKVEKSVPEAEGLFKDGGK